MDEATLPPSDLGRLRDEVLSKAPEAALPSRLSDQWLQIICRDLDVLAGQIEVLLPSPAAAPLALIMHVLSSRATGAGLKVSLPELHRYFVVYRIEVALDILRRHAGASIEPAPLDTIFTDREITIDDRRRLHPT